MSKKKKKRKTPCEKLFMQKSDPRRIAMRKFRRKTLLRYTNFFFSTKGIKTMRKPIN